MKEITELVELPDPAVQPLVHPLDVPEARGQLWRSWLVATMTSPAVGFCLATILWFVSDNYVMPLVAGIAIVGLGELASRFARAQAWSFIPRKRQDRARPLPLSWELGSSLAFAVLLTVGVVLIAVRLHQPDVPADVRDFTFGMAAAIGPMCIVEFLAKVVRYRGDARRRALLTLPGVVAVNVSIAIAYVVLFGSAGVGSWGLVWWGAGVMVAVGILVGGWKYLESRRVTTGTQ